MARTVFFNQLCKKRTHFLDSQEKSHEVTWKSDDLEKFLSFMRERDAAECDEFPEEEKYAEKLC